MKLLNHIQNLEVLTQISPDDQMYTEGHERHYLYVGKSDLLTILNVVNIRSSYPGGEIEISRIFDFGCGHGRVARWLRAEFPNAAIDATDYNISGTEWCVKNYGYVDTNGTIAEDSYDLIWLGSVFTHLPPMPAEALLKQLLSALRPNGVLVFSTQGRFSIDRMQGYDWDTDARPWMHYMLDIDSFEKVAGEYKREGYGYVDYPNQENYGVCIAKPTWYSDRALNSGDFIQILFQEKAVDNHQDVIAFMRAELTDDRKGSMY